MIKCKCQTLQQTIFLTYLFEDLIREKQTVRIVDQVVGVINIQPLIKFYSKEVIQVII